jgi:hypothetical protein
MNARATLAAVSFLAAACTAGSGPAVPVGTENREPPTDTDEPGAQGPDPGSGEYEPPSGSSGTACPACNYVYTCTATAGVDTATTTITLIEVQASPSSTNCAVQNAPPGILAELFECSGAILIFPASDVGPGASGGASGGLPYSEIPWTPYGAGGFSTNDDGALVRCVPTAPYVPQPAPPESEDAG